jgi:BirA family transcriptional regulator, biotin operon repressor / biotin---[acetyl-CoA-carboxylase] ligase
VTTFDLNAVEAGLAGTPFAGHLWHFASVTSTNSLALEAAQAGERSGVWIADEQTVGRGRGGHGWHSSAGDGLYVSALVTPPVALPMTRALWLSLASGLAAQAAIHEASGLDADIRWPNDLLLNSRKCGGILVETAVSPAGHIQPATLRYAVIGIGINVNHTIFPDEIASIATSLFRETNKTVSRETLLIALLRNLDEQIALLVHEHQNPSEDTGLLKRFTQASSWVRGKRVRVDERGGYTGVTSGLDARGFLRVDGDDGVQHTVLSGGVREN